MRMRRSEAVRGNMRASAVFVCLCACAIAAVYGQVSSICRPNERLLLCGGCQATCEDPAPDCSGVCRPGCYCERDEVRNATGHCVKLADCPALPVYKQDTTEPRPAVDCPDNEEYRFCEACNKTCENPNPICPAQCARGCFCVDGLVRERDGRCVKVEQCYNRLQNEIPRQPYYKPVIKPYPYQLTCTDNQVYKDCENCEKTCSNPNPMCPAQCNRGCFCRDGFYRAPNSECVLIENCPKAEISMTAHELTVEDCAPEEEYLWCGWCERTCAAPAPSCARAPCVAGCLCRAPLLRHRSGRCVPPDNCFPMRKLMARFVYV